MKVRTEARRAAILEEAARIFEEVGYERASMNDLAKRLGGSKTTLYGYFPSKEELFGAVVRASATQHLSEATEELKAGAARGDALEPMLMRFAERLLRVLTNDTRAIAVYRMVIAEAGRSEVGKLFYEAGPSECMAEIAKVLKHAMEEGWIRRANPAHTAMQLTALITAETEPRLYQPSPPALSLRSIKGMAERAVRMFLDGAAVR
jgi:AcrR family transcriptional regulator